MGKSTEESQANWTAVCLLPETLDDLKRRVALFDILWILSLDDVFSSGLPFPVSAELRDSCAVLLEEGIARNIRPIFWEPELKILVDPNEAQDIAQLFPKRDEDWATFCRLISNAEDQLLLREMCYYVPRLPTAPANPELVRRTACAYQLRAHAHKARVLGRGSPVVLSPHEDIQHLPYWAGRDLLAQAILRRVPTFPPSMPIRDLIQFRQAPENRRFWLRLKNWVNKLSRDELELQEADELLEYYLLEYSNFMRSLSKRLLYMELQTFFCVSLGLFEKTIRLKPSEAIGKFFALKTAKLDLMSTEASAPGHEIAYIYKLERKAHRKA